MTGRDVPAGRWQDVARACGLLGADGVLRPTVFAEMSALAVRTGSVNLGQGFPDTDGPGSLLADAARAIASGANQYPPGRGIPELRAAIAAHQRRWYGLDADPDTEVLVTAGATEAITAAVVALCAPGDEVIVLEPYYDSYAAAISLAGAVRRAVPLRRPDYSLDADALAAAFTPRTRLVVLNSPHNPTGRVLTRSELDAVARLAVEHDVLVLTDEVYEHLTFDGREHVPLATLPGMADRTLTVSSAGKTFSVTGWKIGWLHARPELVDAVTAVKQFLTYVNGSPFQPAVARALDLPDDFFAGAAARLQRGRDLLVDALAAAGFTVTVPQAGYFVIADPTPLLPASPGARGNAMDGATFCRALPDLVGVVAVPVSAFHDDPATAGPLVRFAFCKRPEILEEAARRLKTLRDRLTP